MVYIQDVHAYDGKDVTLKGWIQNSRSSGKIAFLTLRDGTGFLQCVVDAQNVSAESFQIADKLPQESSIEIVGSVVANPKQVGGFELHVKNIATITPSEPYPISNKPHGIEFLMKNRHLWLRSKLQWAVMRVRNQIIFAIHNFFQSEGFMQMDAPIFTGNACEGTSNLFQADYFEEPAYLSQSGQLYGEAMAMAMGKIYTFGPTFRAEKSKTRRHLTEFWMIEPEMPFYDLKMNMDLIEKFIKSVIGQVLGKCKLEFEVLGRDTQIFEKIVNTEFPRIPYYEAIEILKGNKPVNGRTTIATLEGDYTEVLAKIETLQKEIDAKQHSIDQPNLNAKKKNQLQNEIDTMKNDMADLEETKKNIPEWIKSAKNFVDGNDFGGSDETVLTRLFDVPIMVYNWPHEVKAFYMKRDENDMRWAKGVDVLAPEGYGEVVGGGERETNYELLKGKIIEHGLPMEIFEWYLDLRRYGSVPHSGFGLGLERIVAWMCKLKHIRETIPFPRMYGTLFP